VNTRTIWDAGGLLGYWLKTRVVVKGGVLVVDKR
jgi:hypothetical protein